MDESGAAAPRAVGEIIYACSYGGAIDDHVYLNAGVNVTSAWLETVKSQKGVRCDEPPALWIDFALDTETVLARDGVDAELDVARRLCYNSYGELLASYFGFTTVYAFLAKIRPPRNGPLNRFDLDHARFLDAMLSDVRFIVCVKRPVTATTAAADVVRAEPHHFDVSEFSDAFMEIEAASGRSSTGAARGVRESPATAFFDDDEYTVPGRGDAADQTVYGRDGDATTVATARESPGTVVGGEYTVGGKGGAAAAAGRTADHRVYGGGGTDATDGRELPETTFITERGDEYTVHGRGDAADPDLVLTLVGVTRARPVPDKSSPNRFVVEYETVKDGSGVLYRAVRTSGSRSSRHRAVVSTDELMSRFRPFVGDRAFFGRPPDLEKIFIDDADANLIVDEEPIFIVFTETEQ